MSVPGQAFVRRSLNEAIAALRADVWSALPDEESLGGMPLELDPKASELSAGSRPQVVLLDRQGRRYLFKLAPPDHIAAELLAYRVRRGLRCLHVPTARRTFELPDLGPREGLVQPMIAHEEGRLAADPRDWSPVVTEHLLREHPWEWLLANLDTHVDQYLLVGPEHLPINIDWDHTLMDLAVDKLDRFNMRSATVAPVRNLFYSEYVAGQVRTDFYGMLIEARRIETRISDRRLTKLVRQYCDELGLPAEKRRDLCERMVRRKRSLPAAFDAFVHDIELERRESLGMVPSRRSMAEQATARVQDAWQRLAITVLHDNVVRPSLKAYRVVLGLGERVLGRSGRE
ncbi:MAG: hypothetical protein JNK04_03500 [Myxococcales bacterium]|nr:hypothetical protein [Myxococcales bacterium]